MRCLTLSLSLIGLALAAGPLGCEGQGTGQLSGTLFLRGCPDQGTLFPIGMPAPLPPFALDPQFFAATPLSPVLPDADPRGIKRMLIRLQRSSHTLDRTDGFELYLHDVDDLILQMQRGPIPITVPALGDPNAPYVPLPTAHGGIVLATLSLNGTCQQPVVQPALLGSITFQQLGFTLGDTVAAQVPPLTVQDQRGARAGLAPADQDAAGVLSGSFSMTIQAGPATDSP